jgi:hypothetical protein
MSLKGSDRADVAGRLSGSAKISAMRLTPFAFPGF